MNTSGRMGAADTKSSAVSMRYDDSGWAYGVMVEPLSQVVSWVWAGLAMMHCLLARADGYLLSCGLMLCESGRMIDGLSLARRC